MTLHILSQPPSHPALKLCLAARSDDAPLILIGDGAYCAIALTPAQQHNTFALADDCAARGLNSPVKLINYQEFVALSCQHNPIQSWY